jgi:hypothetical protein
MVVESLPPTGNSGLAQDCVVGPAGLKLATTPLSSSRPLPWGRNANDDHPANEIAHFERSPVNARRGTEGMFGIQSWIALPQAHEETNPSCQHFDAASLPTIEDGGVHAPLPEG